MNRILFALFLCLSMMACTPAPVSFHNTDLTGARDRAFNVIESQRFGAADGVAAEGFHAVSTPLASQGSAARASFS